MSKPPTLDHGYSAEELHGMLARMEEASRAFYLQAVAIGCHSFIEFTGMQNEYIQLCREAFEKRIDFTQTNVHSGQPLPMEAHHAEYVGEQLGCIFGSALANAPDLSYALFSQVLGVRGPRQVLVALVRMLDDADGQGWAVRLRNRLESAVHEYDQLRGA